MAKYFDELEIIDAKARERALFRRLPKFLGEAKSNVPGWKKRLGKIDPAKIKSRAALAQIPVLRKSELMRAQASKPPFGGFADPAQLDGSRIFMSPGPVWEPQAFGPDPQMANKWGGGRAFHAAGIGKGDIVHCAFSFHMTPGGFMLDEGARAAGARVFPAGIGNTEAQIEAASALKPSAYCGTPDYLKILLDKAKELGADLSSIKKALVSGGALFPSLRDEYGKRDVTVMQCYATADLGIIAYETRHRGRLVPGMMCNENLIVEIVRPGTDAPVLPGEVGELVVTNFNSAYPLIRFGTGDLAKLIDEPSPCGRTNLRIAGWMGRADQRTKIKGMFVDPKQIGQLVKTDKTIMAARLVVSRNGSSDAMILQVQPATGAAPDIAAIGKLLTAITKLKGGVELVDALPNDGKVIDDQRDYSK